MVATWTGAVSNDCNNDDNWSPAAVPGAGEETVVAANPTSGPPEILDGATFNVYGKVITLASSCDQTNFIVIGQVKPSGAGALTLTDSEANRIYSDTSGSTLDNQEPINSAGKIFSEAASPPQIFNPTGAA